MEKTKFSKHMTMDRLERYATIATKVGFGETVMTSTCSIFGEHRKHRNLELTSTGVCIVRDPDGTIITMYCAKLSVVKAWFTTERLSKELFTTIRRNERLGYCDL